VLVKGRLYLLALILVSFSSAHASEGAGTIGTVSARGDLRVNGYTVSGNGTLFDGTAVETGQATATLRLVNGTEIMLATNSHGVVYHDHLVLIQGKGQLRASGAPYQLEADGLRVAPSGPNALGVVALASENTIDVAAVTGEFRIVDDTGLALAHIATGAAMAFYPPGQGQAGGSGSPFIQNAEGFVRETNGTYYLATANGMEYELVTGEKLSSFANKQVIVTGFLQDPKPPSRITQLLVTSIKATKSGGDRASGGGLKSNKVLIGSAIAGGAGVVGIIAAESSKSSASR
jgi:hypothetical protein